MNTFFLSQLKEIHELLGLPSQVSYARGRLEGLIATAEVDECDHDLETVRCFDKRSTDDDGEMMNCCTKCDHQEPVAVSDWSE